MLGLLKHRLGQGGYVEIWPSSTNELTSGDVIEIAFPSGSGGWFKYGESERFTVFGVDPNNGKVGVQDQSGDQSWFDGGTREQMLSALASKTSYTTVRILRPSAPPEAYSADEKALIEGAISAGLPIGFGPIRADSYDVARVGDYVFAIAASGGARRLWQVYQADDFVHIQLVSSTSGADTVGETNSIYSTDRVETANEMIFREGMPLFPSSQQEGVIPDSDGIPWIAYAALAVVGVVIATR